MANEELKELADRLEKANQEAKELIERQEKVKAHKVSSGETEAGAPEPVEDENESARQMLKGTGYDKMLFPEVK